MTHPVRYYADEDLAALGVTATQAADAIEAALREKAAGRLWTAPKAALLPGDGRYMMTTLSAADSPGLTVVKSVMVSPRNPARGMPGIDGAVLLQDSETGAVRAVMDAKWITALRTAALSLVAARRLADPAARSIAFIGCGVQARSHLDAFAEAFALTEIRAYGRGAANLNRLCEHAAAKGMTAHRAATAEDAIRGADLVVTSVTLDYTLAPFLDAAWLKPGAFAAITDLALPWAAESLRAVETIIVDDLQQEAAAEKKMIPGAAIAADLAALALSKAAPRFDPARRAAFVFRGIAIGDFAVAALALERAEAAG
ncbi:MAG: ornithine cyclodeaminase family protein [Pseudomonadota bacterium]